MWSGGSQQVIEFDPVEISGSGTLTFITTAWPSVRALGQNIQRSDPYVRNISFNGVNYTLTKNCNDWDEPISICTTTFETTEGGTLDFSLLGPGSWNIWGEFSGHPAQDYTLEIEFTMVDITRPEVSFISPSLGESIDPASPMTIQVQVTDEVAIASVICSFDINGDGDTNDFNEQAAASNIGSDTYEVTIDTISGAPGTRIITVAATDTSFNTREKHISIGINGVGAGESALTTQQSTIPAQPADYSGGARQLIPVGPISVPGMGRITLQVISTPSTRALGQNIQRYDPMIVSINFNGQPITLSPECNSWDSDPAVCVSTWDAPHAGSLNFEILGAASYNIWGEFVGSPEQDYNLEVLFLPGPTITGVLPASGSVAGHETVTVHGSNFAYNAMVLFDEVPATNVVRISSTELTCSSPPGVGGSTHVTVLNPDPDGEPWNYGTPYGLFGVLEDGFTYQDAPVPPPLQPEILLGTWNGSFPAVGSEEAQEQATQDFTIPASGRLRFETWAFIPILNPIPGPFEDPDNLTWHNASTAVTHINGGDGAGFYTDIEYSDLNYPFGSVISNATRIVGSSAAGSGDFTITGPARWNAFWMQFGEHVMISAPAQNWSVAAWFAYQPALTEILPHSGTEMGGTAVTIHGEHFAEGMSVLFDGNPATDVAVSDSNTLACKTPKGSGGVINVAVELLDMTATLSGAYTYLVTDMDADGLSDAVEDASSCLDMNDADTDDDGILDGEEDSNHNGAVDENETDPCNPDSDDDGLQDGTELGYTMADIGPDTNIMIFEPDPNPSTTTDPLNPDTDGDGTLDGDEKEGQVGFLPATYLLLLKE